ncbi:MAG: autotransporter domain-containing protein [Candidatus Thiodiazotropha sp.]
MSRGSKIRHEFVRRYTPLQYLILILLTLYSVNAAAFWTVSPTSAAFGDVVVNTTSTPVTVTFTNENTGANIEIDSITATAPFSVTHDCPLISSNQLLAPTASCTITVVYSPTAIGNDSGTLTILGADRSVVFGSGYLPINEVLDLSGTAIDLQLGELSFQSNGVDFGAVLPGTSATPVPVTLINTGNSTASISTLSATAPFTQTSNCPGFLEPNQSCTVQVSVDSSTLGDISGALSVSGSGPQGAISDIIPLTASVQGAFLSVSDGSLSFPDTEVGSSSASQTITFTNTGNVSLSEFTLMLEGDFTETNNCPATLGAGASCDVMVSAAPTVAGNISGALLISAMSGSSPVSETVVLSVTGTEPAAASDLVPSVSSLEFTDTMTDSESQPQTLTLTNPGSTAVTINGITTEGDFTQTNTCGSSLDAGASCDIQVTFAPQTEGTQSGALVVDTSSGISRITLSGTATAGTPSPSPSINDQIVDALDPYTGGNPNLESLSRVIAEACPAGRLGDQLQADCNVVVGAAFGSDPNTARALQQVVPESATKANNVSRQGGETQVRNLGSRISALRAGARGLSFNGLDWRIDGEDLPLQLMAEAYRQSQGGGASADNQLLESRLGVFVTGDIASGSKDETDLETGLDFDTYGLTVGADYRINNQFILGGAFGVINTQADLNDNAGDLDTQGYSLSLYGTYYSEQNYFIDFAGSYGVNNFEQTRNIVYQLDGLANVNQKLDADYDGDMYSLFVGSGYDFSRGAWSFGPRVDLEYVRSNVDGFTEQVSNANADGGGWATRVEDMDQTWLTMNLGGRVSYTHSTDWGVLIPYARLDWLHEFKDDSQTVNAYFVDDPSPQAIEISTEDPDRDYMRLRLGTSAQFQNGLVGFFDFGTLFANSRWSSNNVSVGIRMEF